MNLLHAHHIAMIFSQLWIASEACTTATSSQILTNSSDAMTQPVSNASSHASSEKTHSPYYLLKQDLLERDATRGKIPPGNGREPVSVYVEFNVFNVMDVDDAKQVVVISAVLAFLWDDVSLSWDDSPSGPYPNISFVELPVENLWKPNFSVMNGAAEDRSVHILPVAGIRSSGQVHVTSQGLLSFICDMEMRVYPFDTQRCELLIFAQAFDVVILSQALPNTPGLLIPFSLAGEWITEKIESHESTLYHGQSNIPLVQYVTYDITIKRKTAYYVASFIAPIVMTSYMNTLVFVLPAQCGERVSYLISIFVSNAVFVSFCITQMPQGITSAPLVMYLLLGIMAESGLLVIAVSGLARFSLRHENVTPDVTRDPPSTVSSNTVTFSEEVKEKAESKNSGRKRNLKEFFRAHVDMVSFISAAIINTIFVATLLDLIVLRGERK